MRKEIADETDRETGRTKQISSVPIHLSIYSPNGMSFHSKCLMKLYFDFAMTTCELKLLKCISDSML